MNLTGKQVLITGGARRCGAALARLFAARGAAVIVHCHKSTAEAVALSAELPGAGHRWVSVDLAEADAPQKIFDFCGKVDILINNASIYHRPGSAEDLAAAADYHRINFLAPLGLMELFGNQKLSEGVVVNILDQAVFVPGGGGYWQSRKDLEAATLKFAYLWGRRNLRVNAVAPGPMLVPAWAPGSKMEKTLASLPLSRPVAVADFAAAVELLCVNDSVTGAILPVDCGQHLQKEQ